MHDIHDTLYKLKFLKQTQKQIDLKSHLNMVLKDKI
jgi:hypothetical protein